MDFIHALNECPVTYVNLRWWDRPYQWGYEVCDPWGEIKYFNTYEEANAYRINAIRNYLSVL